MPVTVALIEGLIADAIAVGKTLDPLAVFVGLYTAGPAVTPPVTAADFTLPNAVAAPAVAVASWGAPHLLADGRVCIDSAAKTFRLPNAVNAFTAVGWYLADAAVGGTILEWSPIAPGVALPDETKLLTIVVRLTLDPNGRWDASVLIDG
jgi:hypothetical protein